MTRYVVGIDTGTGGCKVTFLDEHATIAAESYTPYPSHYEQPRWVEQDPDDWVDAAFEGVRRCLQTLPSGAGDSIDGIAFSAPHHTAVLLDEDDRVIRRAILWNDQRADEESRDLQAEHGDLIARIARNVPAPTWTLPQLLWLSRSRPEEYRRTASLLFMKDYVRWRFTGVKLTDHIDAGGSLFFDVVSRRWSEELLRLIDLDVAVLPEVRAPSAPAGEVTPEAAQRAGVRAGTAVFVGAADTATEVYGAGGVDAGDVTVKLATAGNVQRLHHEPAWTTRLISYEHPVDGLYYLNSATNFAAASFRWFRETFYADESARLGVDETHRLLNEQIAEVEVGSEGMLFHPYLNGERSPYWDSRLRGSFVGMTSRHNRAAFGRAVMEGVAFSIRDAERVYESALPESVRLIGGGANSPVWRQIIADVLDAEVIVPQSTEASFGTCLLAAVGAGWFRDAASAVSQTQGIRARVAPIPKNVDRYRELFEIYRSAATALTAISHDLASFADEAAGRRGD